jgi:hypothetical protein
MHEKSLVIGKKAPGTSDVSYKRQMVITINLSLLELTSKVSEPFFPFTEIFYAIPAAYQIPFCTRNIQAFMLERQADIPYCQVMEWRN